MLQANIQITRQAESRLWLWQHPSDSLVFQQIQYKHWYEINVRNQNQRQRTKIPDENRTFQIHFGMLCVYAYIDGMVQNYGNSFANGLVNTIAC